MNTILLQGKNIMSTNLSFPRGIARIQLNTMKVIQYNVPPERPAKEYKFMDEVKDPA